MKKTRVQKSHATVPLNRPAGLTVLPLHGHKNYQKSIFESFLSMFFGCEFCVFVHIGIDLLEEKNFSDLFCFGFVWGEGGTLLLKYV